ncbi:MAG: GNAT family N-acetyltransferase [Aristaeellaceae bacterium]
MRIRPACAQDTPAMSDMYDWYARNTAITFACHAPSPADYAHKIAEGRYPVLVCEDDGQLLGFAYAGPFRPHDAYRWDVELTIYLRPGQEGRHTGRLLMAPLLALLKRQGYLLAYSCITLPNPRSIGLHKHFGFEELGIFPRTGFKQGQWQDVIWLQLPLSTPSSTPAEPVPFSALSLEEVMGML